MIVRLQQSNTNTTDTAGAGSASIVHHIVTSAQSIASAVNANENRQISSMKMPEGIPAASDANDCSNHEIENMSMPAVIPSASDANAFASYEIIHMQMPAGDVQTVAVTEDGSSWRRVVTGTDGTYSFVNDEQWQTAMDTTTVVQYSQPPQQDLLSQILSTLKVLTHEVQKLGLDVVANTKNTGENTDKLDRLLHLAGASSGPMYHRPPPILVMPILRLIRWRVCRFRHLTPKKI